MMQELSLNVLDVAENSIRAGATQVGIEVCEDTAQDILSIRIEDNGCGMTAEQVARVTDPFYTTRTTRKVGLGVPFFKMAAEMAEGTFDIASEPGVGTTVSATFRHSHVDRMPLGDIASTMALLICANEPVNIRYRHVVDGREFEAETRQFCEILEGVPLSSPEIQLFIGEYLKENIGALYAPEA